jgi:hypothetical protein
MDDRIGEEGRGKKEKNKKASPLSVTSTTYELCASGVNVGFDT